jgi:hypothetical protein
MEKELRKLIRQFLLKEEVLVPSEETINDDAKKEKENGDKKSRKERVPPKLNQKNNEKT